MYLLTQIAVHFFFFRLLEAGNFQQLYDVHCRFTWRRGLRDLQYLPQLLAFGKRNITPFFGLYQSSQGYFPYLELSP